MFLNARPIAALLDGSNRDQNKDQAKRQSDQD